MDAEKLKEYRKRYNLTQKEMAESLGISRKTLNNYENGGNIPLAKEIMIEKLYGEMLNHSHNDATYNTKNNNGGDNIYINNTGGSISNSGNKTGQDKENAGQCNEIKEMTKLLNQLHETKIIEIDRLTKLYNGIITNQNEFIDTLKEQNSQYRKEIESLRQRIKGNTENNKE